MNKNYKVITEEQAEEMVEAFIVFEEPINKNGKEKNYDTCLGVFAKKEEALDYAKGMYYGTAEKEREPIFVAEYHDFFNDSYNCIAEFR